MDFCHVLFFLRVELLYFWLCLVIIALYASTVEAKKPSNTPAVQSILTYHYDMSRTGWNNNETVLTPTNLANFNLLTSRNDLDEQVDAQPLLVPGVSINQETHDVL